MQLIADSGSSKTEWCLVSGKSKKKFITQGISPYFMDRQGVVNLLQRELLPKMKKQMPDEVFYYGTGCSNKENVSMIKSALKFIFPDAKINVDHDLMGAARALCGHEKGIACILGTGSNSCFFSGKKIMKNSPGLGYVLGDEGSGAYLGRKVIQYYLYNTFDPDLRDKFDAQFKTGMSEILEAVYKGPFPNRYMAGFARFLSENRGHFMVENIVEDGLNDFFFNHLYKYRESWTLPIHFTGSVAFAFKDVLKDLCASYELKLGNVIKSPMDGLIHYHAR